MSEAKHPETSPSNLINPYAIVTMKTCLTCRRDTLTGELVCSCGTALITIVYSVLDGHRITEGGEE